jgi:hypothetical protein
VGGVVAVLVGAAAVAGCSSSGGSTSDSAKAGGPAVARVTQAPSGAGGDTAGPTASAGTTSAAKVQASYLERSAVLSVRTPHVTEQLGKARAYVEAAGGYAGDENTQVDAHGHASSSIQLKVPAARYDDLLTRLSGLGTLLDRQVKVADVTGQVVDVASRIRSQQASVARVRALMDRAASLHDVVTLEGELSTREASLESLEAQRDSLRSRTDLATITLRLSEPPVAPAPTGHHARRGFWAAVGHAFASGWHGFYVTLRGIFVGVSAAAPFLAVAAVLAVLGYRIRRRRA